MRSQRPLLIALLGGLALLWGTSPASASFQMSLSDGSTTVLVTDQDLGPVPTPPNTNIDSNPVLGAITFIGSVGSFSVNVTTGTSKPVGGSATLPTMDINSLDVHSAGSATLTIMLTDTDFAAQPFGGTWDTHIGGTITGTASVTAVSYKDPGNHEFVTGSFASPTLGPFTTPSFSGSASGGHGAIPTTFSMTQVVTIAFTGAGQVSLDYSAQNIAPEPSTMAIAGFGALGLIGYGLRRRKASGE